MIAGRVYLGDSVYAEMERGMVKLTTENGFGATNTIYLEAEVYGNLCRYVDAMVRETTAAIGLETCGEGEGGEG